MAPAKRKALDVRSVKDKRRRKGLPNLAEMAHLFVTEDAAVEYLLVQNVVTIPICTTCEIPCLRKGCTWVYRCQKHKFQASLVSPSDLTNSLDLSDLTAL